MSCSQRLKASNRKSHQKHSTALVPEICRIQGKEHACCRHIAVADCVFSIAKLAQHPISVGKNANTQMQCTAMAVQL